MKNAQLWKRILHEGIYDWDRPDVKRNLSLLANTILTATIIVDPRPFQDTSRTGQAIDYSVFNGTAFPFKTFWIEQPSDDAETVFGVLFDGAIDGGDWSGKMYCLAGWPQKPVGFLGLKKVATKGGVVICDTVAQSPGFLGQENLEWAVACCNTSAVAALETLQLLSCKNVSLSPKPIGMSTREERIADRRGGTGGYRYHVLVVRPAGAKPDHPGEEIGNMPRHVCRGHFAEYGPEFGKGLLFGRLAGRFYIPPHMKGDKKNGEVAKDYEVRAVV